MNNIKENKKIIGGALSLTISVIILKLLGVLYKIPLASVLGDEGMGYFNSAYTVYSFFYLLCTAGVPKAVTILLSRPEYRNNGAGKIMNTIISAFSIIGIFIALIFAVLSKPLAVLIGSPESFYAMIFIAPSIIFVSVSGVLRGYLSAEMQLSKIAVSQVLEGALRLAFGLLFAMLGIKLSLSVSVISALTILGATVGALVSLTYLFISTKKENREINLKQNIKFVKKREVFRELFKVSLPITLSAALMSLSGILDLFSVMRRLESIGYTEAEATALYGNYTTLAVSMFNLGVSLITPISVAILPSLAKARSDENEKDFNESLKKGLIYTAFITAPIVLGMSVFSREILTLLFGSTSAEIGAPLLTLLIPGLVFMSIIIILNSALESLGRPFLAMLSMAIGAIVKVIVSGMLLGNSNFGIGGAPLGTVISYAISAFISLLLLSYILGYNIPVLRTSILPYLAASASVLSARVLYDRIAFLSGESIALVAAILFAAVIYIVLTVFFSISTPEMSTKIAKSTNYG